MIINRAFFREAVFVTVAVMVVLLSFFVLQGIGIGFSKSGASGQEASASLLKLIMLYPMVYFALRGRRGPARGGDAVVLTVFAWLSNSLMASLHYLLAVA